MQSNVRKPKDSYIVGADMLHWLDSNPAWAHAEMQTTTASPWNVITTVTQSAVPVRNKDLLILISLNAAVLALWLTEQQKAFVNPLSKKENLTKWHPI